MLIKRMKKLTGIDPKSWEHPADKAALSALKQMKGIDELVRNLVSITTERSLKLMVLASAVKVTQNQYARLHTILADVVDVFDWGYTPNLFVTQSPFWNAGVLGVKEPFIIIHSAMLQGCEDAEIAAVIGHEMGHIMSGHALYKTLVYLLANISLNFIPMGDILVGPIKAALFEWNRKSELSADRAGLLAVQNADTNFNLLMKMAGAGDLNQVNINEFFYQAQEYENQKTLLDSIHKVLNQLWQSHPYPVIRLQELKTWEASGGYQSILEGNYKKRGAGNENVQEDVKGAYEYYQDSVKKGDDPVSNIFNNVGEGLEKAAESIGEKLRDILGNNG
ncbi:MAG: M48 family metallopeptidase [Treponema sp.]|jgi:Zn-dependent protease with chaperone function|nr:M48 family metallopeptidase [Treponema sp.]